MCNKLNELKKDEKLICVTVLHHNTKIQNVKKALVNIFQIPLYDYEVEAFIRELAAQKIGLVKWSGKLAEVTLQSKLNAEKESLQLPFHEI